MISGASGADNEEIGNKPEAPGHIAMECTQLAQRYCGEPVRITLTALRGFNYLFGKKFVCRGHPTLWVKRSAGNVICLAQRLGRLNVETAISEKRYDRGHKALPTLGRPHLYTTVRPNHTGIIATAKKPHVRFRSKTNFR
jgi:hypothetical protein